MYENYEETGNISKRPLSWAGIAKQPSTIPILNNLNNPTLTYPGYEKIHLGITRWFQTNFLAPEGTEMSYPDWVCFLQAWVLCFFGRFLL